MAGMSDQIELEVRVGCMECIEPLNACMVFWEVATTQVIWKGKNKLHLSNAEPYQ